MQVLIVDAANVIGSRPDGWWRDRPGAAQRLHRQLLGADLPADEVLLVLEGRGRQGQSEGQDGSVHTVHAPASGDDTIVTLVESRAADADVTVVTADRALRDRIEAAGGRWVGPSWLLERL
ncbi:MAG TPA: NYN domain-containing protein [Nocardioidaceae bacterium]|nr:NYN domain-containing protein [Nocardioidaceae bacterium]